MCVYSSDWFLMILAIGLTGSAGIIALATELTYTVIFSKILYSYSYSCFILEIEVDISLCIGFNIMMILIYVASKWSFYQLVSTYICS